MKPAFPGPFALVPGLLFLGVSCVPQGVPAADPVRAAPVIRTLAPGMDLEVLPQIELLAAVEDWTTWTALGQPGTPQGIPTAYCRDLKASLEPWSDAPAVKIFQDLQDRGFAWDAPAHLAGAAARNDLAFDRPAEGFSDYLKGRAGGEGPLDSALAALRNLAAQARFDRFFEARRPFYEALADRAAGQFDAGAVDRWLKAYYGDPGSLRFHFVLSPGLQPGGGYSATVDRTEGGKTVRHIYQFLRQAEGLAGPVLTDLSLHEFGHGFVNPAIGDQIPPGARAGLERLRAPVAPVMERMAYPSLETFLNEMVLRAATIRGRETLGLLTAAQASGALRAEEALGFYPIRAVTALLQEYEAHRDRWPAFRDFGPVLLQRLADQSEALAAGAPRGPQDRLASDFEAGGEAPGAPFRLVAGATNNSRGADSEVFFDFGSPASGKSSLSLRGGAGTGQWWTVRADLVPRSGTVRARYQVRGQDLWIEGTQFGNAWVGFVLEKTDGTRQFAVLDHQGTFGWKTEEVKASIDPAQVKALWFGITLLNSGTLSVDAVTVDWD